MWSRCLDCREHNFLVLLQLWAGKLQGIPGLRGNEVNSNIPQMLCDPLPPLNRDFRFTAKPETWDGDNNYATVFDCFHNAVKHPVVCASTKHQFLNSASLRIRLDTVQERHVVIYHHVKPSPLKQRTFVDILLFCRNFQQILGQYWKHLKTRLEGDKRRYWIVLCNKIISYEIIHDDSSTQP